MPFHVPQAPSFCQRAERNAVREDGDLRSSVCGDGLGFAEGPLGCPASDIESKSGEPRLLRARDGREVVFARGAVAVK